MLRLTYTQEVDVSRERVVEFFHDARNLLRITPAFPPVRLLGGDTRVVPGARFRLRIGPGALSIRWTTIIERVDPDGSFVDTFAGGPFVSWRHTHSFRGHGPGTTIVDEIDVEPAWWAAPVARPIINRLFDYRRSVLPRVLA